ncbi:MAG: 3-dehydroquinate synthase [Saprospiraceae bacterium]|nr:3-dehydroquinate synthase [Lewinella sp.]
MKKIQQTFAVPFRYEVLFTEGIFEPNNPCFADVIEANPHGQSPKILFVIDEGVVQFHPQLVSNIEHYAAHYSDRFRLVKHIITVPGGEAAKNDPDLVKTILEAVEQERIDRHSYVAAIGGGAVLDLVGFAASVAHRGVRLIRIPTTVLSQNDSGIGVKNGINYFGKKNFLGAFDPPYAVINDAHFLLTLDDRDWRAGIAEAIKVALIKDASFFELLERDAAAVASRSLPPMQEQIFRCAELHAAHIRGGDPFEKGSSRPLDFGHWAAHKLEQMTSFRLRHGEAVAIGIALDVIYSHLDGRISEEDTMRVIRLIDTLGFPLFVPELKAHLNEPGHPYSVLGGLEEFREHLGGVLTIMLLDRIGHGVEVHEMNPDLITRSILHLEELAAGSKNKVPALSRAD